MHKHAISELFICELTKELCTSQNPVRNKHFDKYYVQIRLVMKLTRYFQQNQNADLKDHTKFIPVGNGKDQQRIDLQITMYEAIPAIHLCSLAKT